MNKIDPLPRAAGLGFVGDHIDRADHIRTDDAALERAINAPAAVRLCLDGLDPVVEGGMLLREPMPADASVAAHVLLGLDDDDPVFVRLAQDLPHGANFASHVWKVAGILKPEELALYGTARSLVDWHSRHGFCAVCGGATSPAKGGWSRRCGRCDAEHFPRVDPVTIMLAEHDGRVLVGRQHRWPQGRYSALAGFVEPGETVEGAVARELYEEAGVRAYNVRYVMSQPWPFPSTLMIACMAEVESDALTLDPHEIEDAIWVDATGVRAAIEGRTDAPFIAPPVMAVAHHLLLHWLERCT
ncbi:MAG: NAD(+) diphosphatase [Sphingobium sp.]